MIFEPNEAEPKISVEKGTVKDDVVTFTIENLPEATTTEQKITVKVKGTDKTDTIVIPVSEDYKKLISEIKKLKPTVSEGKDKQFQIVEIPWNGTNANANVKLAEVFTEFRIELLNDSGDELASADYVFESKKDHDLNISGIEFRYWNFARNHNDKNNEGKPINTAWDRSGYKNGLAKGETEVNGQILVEQGKGFELATKVRIVAKDMSGNEVIIGEAK